MNIIRILFPVLLATTPAQGADLRGLQGLQDLQQAVRHYAQGRHADCARILHTHAQASSAHLYWKARCEEERTGVETPGGRRARSLLRKLHPKSYYTLLSLRPPQASPAERDSARILFQAIERAESAGNPRAVSPKGARGLMQILPSTARDFHPGIHPDRLFEPNLNRWLSHRILHDYATRCAWDLICTLYAYNAGPTRALRWKRVRGSHPAVGVELIPIPETREYVKRVLRFSWNADPGLESRRRMTYGPWPTRP